MLLANGGTRGKVEATILNEVIDPAEQSKVLELTLQRAEVLIGEQKSRYRVFGAIWLLLGLVPLIFGLFWSGGFLLILTVGPIAYGLYLFVQKGNAPADYDQMG